MSQIIVINYILKYLSDQEDLKNVNLIQSKDAGNRYDKVWRNKLFNTTSRILMESNVN